MKPHDLLTLLRDIKAELARKNISLVSAVEILKKEYGIDVTDQTLSDILNSNPVEGTGYKKLINPNLMALMDIAEIPPPKKEKPKT